MFAIFRLLQAFLLIAFASQTWSQKSVSCKHSNVQWNSFKRFLHSCRIEGQRIDSQGFTITSTTNLTVDVLNIQNPLLVTFMPENIAGKFPQLIVLQVINCTIESINDRSFVNLKKLKYLHLPMNEIEVIDRNAFKDLVKLEWLSLFHNNIEYLSVRTFASLENLKFLHLGENRIDVLHSGTFTALKKLEVLNLKNNHLKFLDEKIFSTLLNLKNLSLSNNHFTALDENLLKFNVKLERIWIHGNELQSLDSSMFDDMKSLKYLHMENNTCIDKLFGKKAFVTEEIRSSLRESCRPLKEQLKLCRSNVKQIELNSEKLEIIKDNHL